MRISWITKDSGKIPKTKGFGSVKNGEDCSRNPHKKVAGGLNCDLQSLCDSYAVFCDRHECYADLAINRYTRMPDRDKRQVLILSYQPVTHDTADRSYTIQLTGHSTLVVVLQVYLSRSMGESLVILKWRPVQ